MRRAGFGSCFIQVNFETSKKVRERERDRDRDRELK
jgi:hypothetical protein